MALALPAFNFITGTKSVDGAINVVNAVLGQARLEAIASQKPTGVWFYIDPVSQRRAMALVQEATQRSTLNPNVTFVDTYFDLVPDREPALLPEGVDVQLINDGTAAGTNVGCDRYIGFNNAQYIGAAAAPALPGAQYGGVIVFDGSGRLISPSIAFRCYTDLRDPPNSTGPLKSVRTRTGALLYGKLYDPSDAAAYVSPSTSNEARDVIPGSNRQLAPLRGALGVVVLEAERFTAAGWTLGDAQINFSAAPAGAGTFGSVATPGPEYNEEKWLDENATPLLINRYNGTLVRGQ